MQLSNTYTLAKAENIRLGCIYESENNVACGPCLWENIGDKYPDIYRKFSIYYQNPFGILFHPLAIKNLILGRLSRKQVTQEEEGVFLEWPLACYDAHFRFVLADKGRIASEFLNFRRLLLITTSDKDAFHH